MGEKEARRVPRNQDGTVDAIPFLEALIGPLTFGSMIASCRWGESATLAAFGKRLGISGTHLHDVEKGRRVPSVERAARWARTLGYPESFFVKLVLQAAVDAAALNFVVELSPPTSALKPPAARGKPRKRKAS